MVPQAPEQWLAEQNRGEDQRQASDLVRCQRFTGDRGSEEHAGDRVEQPDQTHGTGAEVAQSGEPGDEGEGRRDYRHVPEPDQPSSVHSGR